LENYIVFTTCADDIDDKNNYIEEEKFSEIVFCRIEFSSVLFSLNVSQKKTVRKKLRTQQPHQLDFGTRALMVAKEIPYQYSEDTVNFMK
jgi:hypothetical protein